MPDVSFVYNPRTRRYRDAQSGRFISSQTVRKAVDNIIAQESQKLKGLASQLVQGNITFAEWQLQSMAQLKTLHVAMSLAANGGIDNTSPSDLGYIGNLVKEQYKFFRGMVADIRQGKQLLNGSLVARVGLYAQAARGSFEKVAKRAAINSGYQEERRVLGASDHCKTCVEEARKSWQKIGSLRAIGDSECKSNCRCAFQYK